MNYKKGKFYTVEDRTSIVMCLKSEESQMSSCYGIGLGGEWFEGGCNYKLEATREEWFEALRNYANEKGYQNGGYKCLITPNNTYFTGWNKTFSLENDGTELWYEGNCIMKDGVWAEITKEEPIETRTKLDDCFYDFARWVIENKRSVFIDSDIPKESKSKILNTLGYSSNSLND